MPSCMTTLSGACVNAFRNLGAAARQKILFWNAYAKMREEVLKEYRYESTAWPSESYVLTRENADIYTHKVTGEELNFMEFAEIVRARTKASLLPKTAAPAPAL